MSLTLHRLIISDPHTDQLFLFSLDQVHLLREGGSLESEELEYGGHNWILACAVKHGQLGRGVGFHLKLKNQQSSISVNARFRVSLLHQLNNHDNITFSSPNHLFSSQHPLCGTSKLVLLDRLLNNGYLDGTGKRALVELNLLESCTRFQTLIDTSVRGRQRKNPNGVSFDSPCFHLANHRWFLRFYLCKLNNGLPAVYLYMQDVSTHSVSIQLQFILFLGTQATQDLHYDFGDGAKYDGFGKTLQTPIANADRLTEIEVAVDIIGLCVYKFVPLQINRSVPTPVKSVNSGRRAYSPRAGSPYSSRSSSPHRMAKLSEAPNQFFHDHLGNQWRLNLSKETQSPSSTHLLFDKGIYHYPNNRTTLVSLQIRIMSQNTSDHIACNIITAYFSNFTDDKGYLLNFPVDISKLRDQRSLYLNDSGEMVVRVDFLSVQTSPHSERSGPKYDSFVRQIFSIRQGLEENSQTRELSSSRSASRDSSNRAPSRSSNSNRALSRSSNSSGIGNPMSPADGVFISTNPNTKHNPNLNHVDSSTTKLNHYSNHYLSFNSNHNPSPNAKTPVNPAVNSTQSSNQESSDPNNESPTKDKINNNEKNTILNHNEKNTILKNNNNEKKYINENNKYNNSFLKDLIHNLSLQRQSRDKGLKTATKPHHHPPSNTPRYNDLVDETSLLRMSASEPHLELQSEDQMAMISRIVKNQVPFLVEEVVLLPSPCSISDADVIIVCPDLPRTDHCVWMPVVLSTLAGAVRREVEGMQKEEIGKMNISSIHSTPFSIQVHCHGGKLVEVVLSGDYGAEANLDRLYEQCMKLRRELSQGELSQEDFNEMELYHEPATCLLRKKFFEEIDEQAKAYMRVVMVWRDSIDWGRRDYTPNNYLLSLLTLKAYQLTDNKSLFKVLQKLNLLVQEAELRISWDRFYKADCYEVSFEPPTPLVQDPTNPVLNVASRLKYWGLFRRELLNWLAIMKLNLY